MYGRGNPTQFTMNGGPEVGAVLEVWTKVVHTGQFPTQPDGTGKVTEVHEGSGGYAELDYRGEIVTFHESAGILIRRPGEGRESWLVDPRISKRRLSDVSKKVELSDVGKALIVDPNGERKSHDFDVAETIETYLAHFEASYFSTWLVTPVPALQGETPKDLIEDGRARDITAVLRTTGETGFT